MTVKFLVDNTHLGRWVICVADARTPGGEVKKGKAPKVWSSGETVLTGRRGQLPGAGGGAVAPVTINGPQVFLLFQKLKIGPFIFFPLFLHIGRGNAL